MDESETSKTYKRKRQIEIARKKGNCTICPPHGGENVTRYKRSPKKPKKKDHRK